MQATSARRAHPLSHDQALRLVESFTRFPVVELTTRLSLAAMAACRRYVISYWDAAIIEASRALGCSIVLSEDLCHGQQYDGVAVQNPFV